MTKLRMQFLIVVLAVTSCRPGDPGGQDQADAASPCFGFSQNTAPPTRESEPNDAIGEADEMGDGSFTGRLAPGEVDVVLTRSGGRAVRVTGCSADVQVTLLDVAGTVVATSAISRVSETSPQGVVAVFAEVRATGETDFLLEVLDQ